VLEGSREPLVERYDLVMLDLDGVVYVGEEAVPGAAEALRRVRETGLHLAYVTNNASRAPDAVAEKLSRLGVEAEADDVVTSAQAAAHLLAERYPEGSPVANLGAEGLRRALAEEGLVPTDAQDEDAVAIVTGYNPDLVWSEIMRAAMRIRDGLPWVASNTDLTFPLEGGEAPGHGVLVEMVSRFSRVDPVVAG
jgi:HAD superfamily hydrolase (TIGR01450 family)